jgi:hypothetical protein
MWTTSPGFGARGPFAGLFGSRCEYPIFRDVGRLPDKVSGRLSAFEYGECARTGRGEIGMGDFKHAWQMGHGTFTCT